MNSTGTEGDTAHIVIFTELILILPLQFITLLDIQYFYKIINRRYYKIFKKY